MNETRDTYITAWMIAPTLPRLRRGLRRAVSSRHGGRLMKVTAAICWEPQRPLEIDQVLSLLLVALSLLGLFERSRAPVRAAGWGERDFEAEPAE